MKRIIYTILSIFTIISCELLEEDVNLYTGNNGKGSILFKLDRTNTSKPIENIHIYAFDSLDNITIHKYHTSLASLVLLAEHGTYTFVIVANMGKDFTQPHLTFDDFAKWLRSQEYNYPYMCTGMLCVDVIQERNQYTIEVMDGTDAFPIMAEIILDKGQETAFSTHSTASVSAVNFTSTKDWTATISKNAIDWCSLSSNSEEVGVNQIEGTAKDGCFFILTESSMADTNRTATITITSEDATQIITLTQEKRAEQAKITLEVAADTNLTAPSVVYSKVINFSSTKAWTVAVIGPNTEWCTTTSRSGENGGKAQFTINATPNETDTTRTATITITSEDVTKIITLIQEKAPEQAKIILDVPTDENLTTPSVLYSKVINFNSTKAWTVAVTGMNTEWCTTTSKSGENGGKAQFTINATANETVMDRTATITITSENITKIITLIQEKTPEQAKIILDVPTDENLTILSVEYSKIISFTSKDAWTVSITESDTQWCSIASKSGENGGKAQFTINATPNETDTTRGATVTIQSKDETLTIILTQVSGGDFGEEDW